jgi:hypothetical protein
VHPDPEHRATGDEQRGVVLEEPVASFGVGGIGVALSFVTLVAGGVEKQRLDRSYNLAGVSSFSRSQAEGLAGSANALFTTSLVALLVGLAALGFGAALWIFG